jgi:predicted transcriptional regulator
MAKSVKVTDTAYAKIAQISQREERTIQVVISRAIDAYEKHSK